jgi:hypothetical protein
MITECIIKSYLSDLFRISYYQHDYPPAALLLSALSEIGHEKFSDNPFRKKQTQKCICLYDQQDATYIMIFIINNALHVSGVFRPSSGAYELYKQLMVMAC